MTKLLNILQVSTRDHDGGAERVALNLTRPLDALGYDTYLAVGDRRTEHEKTLLIPNAARRTRWESQGRRVVERLNSLSRGGLRGAWTLGQIADFCSSPLRWLDQRRGREIFAYPGTWSLLSLPPTRPDIVHCHNLHGDYFDLRFLPLLSSSVPTFLTLHDAWLLSGHCAHCFDCERWKSGCGRCPRLDSYPAVKRDQTSFNWLRKREIFSRSRVYVATPSRWLMAKVEASILSASMIEGKVIHNGVDLEVFHPYDKAAARRELGLPLECNILLFAAKGGRRNIWKDFETLHESAVRVSQRMGKEQLLFVALGEDGSVEEREGINIRYVKHQQPHAVARYFQAADLYVHAAHADTFPNVVIEALACGTPVVATAVGGIPEQVKSLGRESAAGPVFSREEGTGVLVPPRDAEVMAGWIISLLQDRDLLQQIGRNAALDAAARFDLVKQASCYAQWYRQGRDEWQKRQLRESTR